MCLHIHVRECENVSPYERISSVSLCWSYTVDVSISVCTSVRKHVPDFKNVHVQVEV